MKLALISDAWHPQVNGVVRTWGTICEELESMGHEVLVVHPDQFRTMACPTYPEIRLALMPGRRLRRIVREFGPDAVHIATEGPLGQAGRKLCLQEGWHFTTSFHTRFPEYIHQRIGLPIDWSYRWIRNFHSPAKNVLVPTKTVQHDLERRGFENVQLWNRGVDLSLFRTDLTPAVQLPRPVFLSVGRVAPEKNLEAFLSLELPGSKLVVGDGPARKSLEARYPNVVFAGTRHGEELARYYASADVFVFPSQTDTFGLVMLEAMASGLPVAAFPVTGPIDVVGPNGPGVLSEDLASACIQALAVDRAACRAFALEHTWRRCTETLLSHLVPVHPGRAGAVPYGA
ncbi:MAG: glycosyltransferase family 1 protein [Planctomycetota bacterium]